jgi:hypothetical protein
MPRKQRQTSQEYQQQFINELINNSKKEKTISIKIKKHYSTRYRKTSENVKLSELKNFIEYLEPEDRFYIEEYPEGWYLNENYLNIDLIFDLHATLQANPKIPVGYVFPEQKQIYQVRKEKILITI